MNAPVPRSEAPAVISDDDVLAIFAEWREEIDCAPLPPMVALEATMILPSDGIETAPWP